MKFIPHDYQKYAIEYIKNNPIAAVLLDMGLGKTVITLTAINDLLNDSFEVSKILIIAPLRVAKTTWSDEIRKWEHLHFLRYSVAVGTEKERLDALHTPTRFTRLPISTSSTEKTSNGSSKKAACRSTSIWW